MQTLPSPRIAGPLTGGFEAGTPFNQSRLTVFGVELDEDEQTATPAGGEAQLLTAIEFRLLRYFMLNPGKVLSKAQLGEHVYSDRPSPIAVRGDEKPARQQLQDRPGPRHPVRHAAPGLRRLSVRVLTRFYRLSPIPRRRGRFNGAIPPGVFALVCPAARSKRCHLA
ncbi:hypothetical protein C2U68_01500 [Methylomonas koyamae]|nr:hypothetical protein C2U68_01500 [Methylomonas koyamae]